MVPVKLRLLIAAAGLSALACGSNTPEIPPELLRDDSDGGGGDYPSGPFGTDTGSVVQDANFSGWMNPSAVGFQGDFETVSFADFYDPDGSKGNEIILINTAAVWCSACKDEHQDLPEFYEKNAERGFVVVSLLFQDARGEPADRSDLELWTEVNETNFPMALDPDFKMGAYASAETAPLNLIVDARNMVILEKFIGNQAAVIESLIERELDERSSN